MYTDDEDLYKIIIKILNQGLKLIELVLYMKFDLNLAAILRNLEWID
jgi:hypothetical protein